MCWCGHGAINQSGALSPVAKKTGCHIAFTYFSSYHDSPWPLVSHFKVTCEGDVAGGQRIKKPRVFHLDSSRHPPASFIHQAHTWAPCLSTRMTDMLDVDLFELPGCQSFLNKNKSAVPETLIAKGVGPACFLVLSRALKLKKRKPNPHDDRQCLVGSCCQTVLIIWKVCCPFVRAHAQVWPGTECRNKDIWME